MSKGNKELDLFRFLLFCSQFYFLQEASNAADVSHSTDQSTEAQKSLLALITIQSKICFRSVWKCLA